MNHQLCSCFLPRPGLIASSCSHLTGKQHQLRGPPTAVLLAPPGFPWPSPRAAASHGLHSHLQEKPSSQGGKVHFSLLMLSHHCPHGGEKRRGGARTCRHPLPQPDAGHSRASSDKTQPPQDLPPDGLTQMLRHPACPAPAHSWSASLLFGGAGELLLLQLLHQLFHADLEEGNWVLQDTHRAGKRRRFSKCPATTAGWLAGWGEPRRLPRCQRGSSAAQPWGNCPVSLRQGVAPHPLGRSCTLTPPRERGLH